MYGGTDEELCVKGYTDASFQTDQDEFKSQSGYVFLLNELEEFQAEHDCRFYNGVRVYCSIGCSKGGCVD